LDGKRIAELKVVNDNLESALEDNDAKESKNHFTVVAKNTAVGEVKGILSGFRSYLVGKTDTVTDTALEQLNIPPRHHVKHEPLPPPADAPVVVIHTGHNHDADLYFFDNQAGHPTKYLANPNYYAVKFKYRLVGATDWELKTITKKHRTLHFGNEAQGKVMEITATWLNPTLEPGPWSDVESAIIT
jgi:hypothetical protein